MEYLLNDIVGTTYFATREVGLTRLPNDGAAEVFTVKNGQPVGVVDSYLLPKMGRSSVWLAFNDNSGRPYYVEIKAGQTDVSKLSAQGVTDVETKLEEARKAGLSTQDKIFSSLKILLIVAVVAYLLKEPIKNALSK